MPFINNAFDVTMTPPGNGNNNLQAVFASMASRSGQTFEAAAVTNQIYRGNGLPCQQRMCASLVGCDSPLGCPGHPDWNRVVEFCGPIQTSGLAADGAWWTRIPADNSQQMLTATQRFTGLTVLPTPFNVTGMY